MKMKYMAVHTLRKKSPYSVQIRENNSEYGRNDEICPVDQSVNYLGASGILPVLHAFRELK